MLTNEGEQMDADVTGRRKEFKIDDAIVLMHDEFITGGREYPKLRYCSSRLG